MVFILLMNFRQPQPGADARRDVNVLLQTVTAGTDVIAGKAFDYLASDKPLLAVVDPCGGDAWC
jgi:hypothetical protein